MFQTTKCRGEVRKNRKNRNAPNRNVIYDATSISFDRGTGAMNSPINSEMGAKEWVMLLTLSLLWGGSFFFVEVVISELPVITVVFLRVALAAVALWLFAIVMGLRPPMTIRAWTAFLIMGLLNNVIPFTLIVWSQTHIASGLASILNASTPALYHCRGRDSSG